MKKFLKWLLIILAVLLIGGFIAVKVMSDPLPEGEKGPAAEQLAENMFSALNKTAFDTLPYLSWTFFDNNHTYLWDKQNHKAKISWGDKTVLLNLKQVDGKAFENGTALEGEAATKAIQTAWNYWCNDSWWLVAPFKAKDAGTVRSVVQTDQAAHGLLVQYESGGVTPGDAYLWLLDEDFVPIAYRMWVQILPVKGLKATWEGYDNYLGAKIASDHKMGPIEMKMTGVKAGNSLTGFGETNTLFDGI